MRVFGGVLCLVLGLAWLVGSHYSGSDTEQIIGNIWLVGSIILNLGDDR